MYDVFYSFNILNTSFNIGFCITVKRLEQSWFVRYINVYYYYYYYYYFYIHPVEYLLNLVRPRPYLS